MMTDQDCPIAIFGGTFDPVHNGHLRVAWEASEALDAKVYLMPSRQPPHRPPPVASAEQRVELLRIALRDQDRLLLDTRELRRPGPSYTIDTLIELRNEVGPVRPLVLLIGVDAFVGLPSWDRWQELFDLAHVGVLARPGPTGDRSPALQRQLSGREVQAATVLHFYPSGKIIQIPVSALDISATAIRAELARGGQARYLLPDALCQDRGLLDVYRRSGQTAC